MELREKLSELPDAWEGQPGLSWSETYAVGEELLAWKERTGAGDIWRQPPTMVTATLDDALGQGLKMIHLYSRVLGIHVFPLGLMQSEDTIVESCNERQPDFLGLTVLQFDTEEILETLISRISDHIQVIVGGPLFRFLGKDELEQKPYIVLNTIGAYIDFFLER